MLPFSPDHSENPCKPGFGLHDCNGEREQYRKICQMFLLQKTIIEHKFMFHLAKNYIFNMIKPLKTNKNGQKTFRTAFTSISP